MPTRLRHRIGRRGAFLLFLATLDLIYAYSLLAPNAEALRSTTFRFVTDVAPLWAWAALWGITGLLCLVQAFRISDKLAFGAAMLTKVMWGMLFLAGWVAGQVPRGYLSAAIWLFFAVVIAIIATWPEPAAPDESRSWPDPPTINLEQR